jgi:hypothetical protein
MRIVNRRGAVSIGIFYLLLVAPAGAAWSQDEEAIRCNKASEANQVLLTVVSDAECKLTVNDKPYGTLLPNQEKTFNVDTKRQVARCASTRFPGAVAQDEQLLPKGCGWVRFEVDALWRRFTAEKSGGVKDTETGLTWAQSDNGKDIDWNGAKQYCAEKGGRLPTQEELRTLHLGDALNTPCGEFPCKVSQHFKLTGRFFWSSSTFEDQAIVVGLAGVRPAVQSVKPATTKDARVLCISSAE